MTGGADPLEWLKWERSRPAGSRLEFQRQLPVMDEQLVDAGQMLSKRDDQVDLLQKVLLTGLYTGEQSVEEAVSLALIAATTSASPTTASRWPAR